MTKRGIEMLRKTRRTGKKEVPYVKIKMSLIGLGIVGIVLFSNLLVDKYMTSEEVDTTQSIVLAEEFEDSSKLIVIDAGHGGIDPGSTIDGSIEKDINLEVALKLQKALEQAGYSVVMTRNDDSEVSLRERADIANDVQADLFISLHQNSYGEDNQVNGIEVYYNSSTKSDESEHIANLIQTGLVEETGARDRGTKVYNELVVTRETQMPSCLVEMGYLSSVVERSLLESDSYQDKIVKGILEGINRFFE